MLHTENLEPTSCSSYDELLFSHVHPYVVTREALCASVTSTCFNTHCLYWMYVRTFCRERPGVLLRRPCGHEAASVLMLLRNSININQSTISQHWSSLKAHSSTQNGTDCKQYSNSHYRFYVLCYGFLIEKQPTNTCFLPFCVWLQRNVLSEFTENELPPF